MTEKQALELLTALAKEQVNSSKTKTTAKKATTKKATTKQVDITVEQADLFSTVAALFGKIQIITMVNGARIAIEKMENGEEVDFDLIEMAKANLSNSLASILIMLHATEEQRNEVLQATNEIVQAELKRLGYLND